MAKLLLPKAFKPKSFVVFGQRKRFYGHQSDTQLLPSATKGSFVA
jgi:hypothetical protein